MEEPMQPKKEALPPMHKRDSKVEPPQLEPKDVEILNWLKKEGEQGAKDPKKMH